MATPSGGNLGSNLPLVVAITGASGVAYGQRLVETLMRTDVQVHLTISQSGKLVLKHEMGIDVDLENFKLNQLVPGASETDQVRYYHHGDFMTPIASGAFKTRAMVVCPCSGSTMSGIATAASRNLIQRAADVHLKERRPLILVPRETPLSQIQIENMLKTCQAGATILPASPGFYHEAKTIDDMINFVVARILDHLDIEHDLIKRWGA